MRSRSLCGVFVVVCLWVSNGYAEDKKMVRAAAPVQARREASQQRNLPGNVQPSAPKLGRDVPSKNTRFMGHQGGYKPVQIGGTQGRGFVDNSGQGLPQGGPDWQNRPRGDKTKKGSVNDFGRDAQLTKLADPRAGLQDRAGKDADFSDRFADRSSGRGALTGGDEMQNFLASTLTPGTGKNQSSKRSQQSDDSALGSQGGAAAAPIPYPVTTENKGSAPIISYPSSGSATPPASTGNEAGALKGVASGNTGDFKPITTSSGVKIEGAGVTRKAGTPNPDAVDDSHVPEAIKNFYEKKPVGSKETEAGRKRQVTLPGESGRSQAIGPDDIEVTGKDMIAKRTDGRIQPVDQDRTTVGGSGGANPDVEIDPMTGQPKKGKTHGGGGDPPEPNAE